MKEYTILAAPDSFKGSIGAIGICSLIEEAACREGNARVVQLPLADGGEGTVEAYLKACGGEKVLCKVTGPDFDSLEAFYGILPDGTAVIEMAQASGLALTRLRDPSRTTTLGTGELIAHALDRGCRRFIIGIGGSATNDGGIGAAFALGARFFDEKGALAQPTGEGMGQVASMDLTGLDKRLGISEILTACDVNNPLFGKNGAAYIYGPQKGADRQMIEKLDASLRRFANLTREATGKTLEEVPGAGAAGGLGYGLMAFFGARLESGIDLILEAARFDEKLKAADLVITGEGRLDGQSLMGKAISGIAARCVKRGVPVVALAGSVALTWEELKESGLTAAFSIQKEVTDFETALERTEENILFSAGQVIRFLKSMEKK